MSDSKDYYKTLELDTTATADQIKSNYRKLMKKYHPDVNPSPEAAELSRKINEAYEVLSDPAKKQEYDNPTPMMDFGGGGPFDPFSSMFFNRSNPFDPFSQFLNGQQEQHRRNSDLNITVNVNTANLFKGIPDADITYNVKLACSDCDGTGYASKDTCPQCQGSGKVVQRQSNGMFTSQTITGCGICKAKGYIVRDTCKKCNGFAFSEEKREIKIENIASNLFQTLRFPGKGNSDASLTTAPGDLYVIVNPIVEEGAINPMDLSVHISHNIDALNFIAENKIKLPGLNNEWHEIQLMCGNTEYVVKEGGIPRGTDRSNMVLTINPVLYPVQNKELKEQILKNLNEVK